MITATLSSLPKKKNTHISYERVHPHKKISIHAFLLLKILSSIYTPIMALGSIRYSGTEDVCRQNKTETRCSPRDPQPLTLEDLYRIKSPFMLSKYVPSSTSREHLSLLRQFMLSSTPMKMGSRMGRANLNLDMHVCILFFWKKKTIPGTRYLSGLWSILSSLLFSCEDKRTIDPSWCGANTRTGVLIRFFVVLVVVYFNNQGRIKEGRSPLSHDGCVG